jgi:hypothetical protein
MTPTTAWSPCSARSGENVEILARLVGEKVLCGMPNEHGRTTCRGELARVEEWQGIRLLCIPDGWKRKARGHFTLSNHSVHLRKGVQLKVGKGDLAADQAAGQGRPRNHRPTDRPQERDAYLAGYGLTSVSAVFESISIPATGIRSTCPRCGHINTLTASLVVGQFESGPG